MPGQVSVIIHLRYFCLGIIHGASYSSMVEFVGQAGVKGSSL